MRTFQAFLVALAFGWPAAAHAEDYVFTVPVRVENMRHVTDAAVQCVVFRVTSGVIREQITRNAYAAVPLSEGSFNGELTVRAELAPGFRRDDANRWMCSISYYFNDETGARFSRTLRAGETTESWYTRITGQEVASVVRIAEGEIGR